MTMNLRVAALAAALAAGVAGTVAIDHGQAQAQGMRGDVGSDRNLRTERRRLEGVIDALQRDQHDYGGHRVRAIADLQQARAELDAALQYDRGH